MRPSQRAGRNTGDRKCTNSTNTEAGHQKYQVNIHVNEKECVREDVRRYLAQKLAGSTTYKSCRTSRRSM